MRIFRSVFVLLLFLFAAGQSALGQTVSCASDDGKRNYCSADTSQGVTLVKQRSDTPCTQGYSWDFDYRGIWVDHGCRADFALQPPPNPDDRVVTCSSEDGRRHNCKADTRGGVLLLRQRSGSPCIEGSTWGQNEGVIWVDQGCRGDFALQRPARREYGNAQTLTCSSDDGRRNYCPADTRGGVQLVNQRSGSTCTQGYSWDYDNNGVWVDHGCRADFAIGGNGYAGATDPGTPVSCSSDDGRRNYCTVDTRWSQVQLVRQRSGSPCVEGSTWGHDEQGIWVDRGCRADFLVQKTGGSGRRRPCVRSVGERRANELVGQCLQVSPSSGPTCDVQNSCKMITDEIRRGCELLGRDAPGFCDEYR